jgi:hypothetical protein
MISTFWNVIRNRLQLETVKVTSDNENLLQRCYLFRTFDLIFEDRLLEKGHATEKYNMKKALTEVEKLGEGTDSQLVSRKTRMRKAGIVK